MKTDESLARKKPHYACHKTPAKNKLNNKKPATTPLVLDGHTFTKGQSLMYPQLDTNRLYELMQSNHDKSFCEIGDIWLQEHRANLAAYEKLQKELARTTTTRQYSPPPPPPQWVLDMKRGRLERDRREDEALAKWSKAKYERDKSAYAGATTSKQFGER